MQIILSFEDDFGFIPVSALGRVARKLEEKAISWQEAATDSCQEVNNLNSPKHAGKAPS